MRLFVRLGESAGEMKRRRMQIGARLSRELENLKPLSKEESFWRGRSEWKSLENKVRVDSNLIHIFKNIYIQKHIPLLNSLKYSHSSFLLNNFSFQFGVFQNFPDYWVTYAI